MSKFLGTSLLILWLQSDWVKSQQNSAQQQVKQNPPSLSVTEGGISILNCDYDNTILDYFQWYRKYPAKSPTSLISISSVLEKNEDGRFTVFHNRSAKHLSLHISASQPGDSALYLCAANTCSLLVITLKYLITMLYKRN
uniref:T cell receptor alpha variable 29/delta variable 5 n=1 Tax=Capra hircus TaxID=9925 RepID=A0A452EKG1_CAPHI